RALARRPKIYLFDEPLSNLDAKLRVEMRTEVKKLHRRLGTTIVYVTHDQIEAMTLADRIAVMKDGVVQQLGTPEEIYERPANLFVAGFIGSPPMNQIPIDVSEAQGKVVALLTGSDGQRMALPLGDGYRHLLGQSLLLGLRPEAITEVQPHRFDHASVCREHFTVIMTEPTGPDILTLVQLNGVEVCARLAPQAAPVIGQPVELMFDSARALLFDPASQQRLAPQQDRAAA
ncbi:MAG: TOBE domain-containing protein, partial [Corallincola sp.]|nr:TOBE domain-containing protein [Corallincola sp.]